MRPLMLNTQDPFPFAEAASVASAPPPAPAYRIRHLFTPPADHGFRPTALNDRGDIVGNLVRPPRFQDASWLAHGVLLAAEESPEIARNHLSQDAWPYAALSSNGLIAGTHGAPADTRRAWASHLGEFGELHWPGSVSLAQAVNAHGVVVGKTLLPVAPLLISRAFILGPGGRPRFFNPPEGGMTDAIAVNDAGAVLINVNGLATTGAAQRAWLWHDQVWIPLETPAGCASVGTALAADGTAAGYIRTAGALECAALWREGRLIDLGTPFDSAFHPLALRDAHLVVGTARQPDGRPAAARWTPRDGLQFLHDLLVPHLPLHLSAATGVNTHGTIIAASDHGARSAGFLLQPFD